MKPNTRTNRSLLGLNRNPETNERSKFNELQNEQLMVSQNEKHLEELALTSAKIRDLSIDIGGTIDKSSRYLDDMKTDTFNAQGLLSGTMKKLSSLKESGSTKQMCYMILFIVVLFIALYYLITRSSSTNTANKHEEIS